MGWDGMGWDGMGWADMTDTPPVPPHSFSRAPQPNVECGVARFDIVQNVIVLLYRQQQRGGDQAEPSVLPVGRQLAQLQNSTAQHGRRTGLEWPMGLYAMPAMPCQVGCS